VIFTDLNIIFTDLVLEFTDYDQKLTDFVVRFTENGSSAPLTQDARLEQAIKDEESKAVGSLWE